MLFEALQTSTLSLKNRLCMPPMCTYRAQDGFVNFFHKAHYGTVMEYGMGMVIMEATSVHPDGRISLEDLGIWKDEHIPGLSEITAYAKEYNCRIGIQLAHAGPKTHRSLVHVGPTNVAYPGYETCQALTVGEIKRLVQDFQDAARRAQTAHFETIEIHAAHGYLVHSFLSPVSNTRTDEYGGSQENRNRFLIEIIRACQTVFTGAIGVRFSAEDYVDHGNHIEEYIAIAKEVEALGVAYIDVSSGGIAPVDIPVGPGYQVPLSAAMKQALSIPVFAVGRITTSSQAEEILQQGYADVIQVGKELLRDPGLARRWANEQGATLDLKSPLNYPNL
jgi:NADPH2 dehydrogenase